MALFKVLIADWNRIGRDDIRALVACGPDEPRLAAARRYIVAGAFDSYTLRADSPEAVFQILNVATPRSYLLRPLSCGDVVLNLDTHAALVCAPLAWMDLTTSLCALPLPDTFWMLGVCPDCHNAQFIHSVGVDGATIQRCDTCSNHLTDADAESMHDTLCGCRHVDSLPDLDIEVDATTLPEG